LSLTLVAESLDQHKLSYSLKTLEQNVCRRILTFHATKSGLDLKWAYSHIGYDKFMRLDIINTSVVLYLAKNGPDVNRGTQNSHLTTRRDW
jgi:hypothetical protein